MPNLSPNPSDETNHLLRLLVMRADNTTLTSNDLSLPFSPDSNSIAVNCLLYASLSCSLIVAVGAMMAKEWLQSFDRTGQTGPLEDQGRLRQRKLNGVKQWHLEGVIKFLPNLLLSSVILFLAGIGLFLYPISAAVAGIVIAFLGLGAVFVSFVIVAGAIFPTCPYQSAASSGLRHIVLALLESWRMTLRTTVRPVASIASERLSKFRTGTRRRIRPIANKAKSVGQRVRGWYYHSLGLDDPEDGQAAHQYPYGESGHQFCRRIVAGFSQAAGQAQRQWRKLPTVAFSSIHLRKAVSSRGESSEQILTGDAARWLFGTTANYGDQISTTQIICSLPRATCAYVFEDPDSWDRLFDLTMRALEIWSSRPNEVNQQVAELFGLVLCRVLSQGPKEDDKWKDITERAPQQSNQVCAAFLKILERASSKYSQHQPEDEECMLHTAVLSAVLGGGLDIGEFRWAKLSRLIGSGSHIAVDLFAVWVAVFPRMCRRYQTAEIIPLSLGEIIELLDSR